MKSTIRVFTTKPILAGPRSAILDWMDHFNRVHHDRRLKGTSGGITADSERDASWTRPAKSC
jgi:hypothetical protein